MNIFFLDLLSAFSRVLLQSEVKMNVFCFRSSLTNDCSFSAKFGKNFWKHCRNPINFFVCFTDFGNFTVFSNFTSLSLIVLIQSAVFVWSRNIISGIPKSLFFNLNLRFSVLTKMCSKFSISASQSIAADPKSLNKQCIYSLQHMHESFCVFVYTSTEGFRRSA